MGGWSTAEFPVNEAKPFQAAASPGGADKLIAEITWDLVMSDDMAFADGCYRTGDADWQVITATKANGLRPVGVRHPVRWESGVSGMAIVMPDHARINAAILLAMMSALLGVSGWREVRGPDSMTLR